MAHNYRRVGAFHSQGDGHRPKITILKNQLSYFYLKIMFGVLDHHFNNLHNLMAHNYRCVGAFHSQGDGPRPEITILKNHFCHGISISKSCLRT